MKNGLYSVQFRTPLGMGAGIIHAVDGQLWGGDAGLYYVGVYQSEGDHLTATVTTDRHVSHPGIRSVFGVDRVEIKLIGTIRGDNISAKGTAASAPGVSFSAELRRLPV